MNALSLLTVFAKPSLPFVYCFWVVLVQFSPFFIQGEKELRCT